MTEKSTDTIRIFEEDKRRIQKEGAFGESYAEVVNRILNESEELRKKVRDQNPLMALISEPIPA